MTDRLSTNHPDRRRRHHRHWSRRHYDADHVTGPLAFLNPTTRIHAVVPPGPKPPPATGGEEEEEEEEDAPGRPPTEGGGVAGAAAAASGSGGDGSGGTAGAGGGGDESPWPGSSIAAPKPPRATGVYTVWRSRDNRKGRHALALTPSAVEAKTGVAAPSGFTDTWSAALAGLGRMVLRYPVWDVSYDVAVIFTLGSIVWVLNGFFVLLPITNPADTFPGESAWGGGVSAAVGATIFEVGSILLMLEAVNENRSACFGWALEHGAEGLLLLRRDRAHCRHHHAEKGRLLSRQGARYDGTVAEEEQPQPQPQGEDDGGVDGRGMSGGSDDGAGELVAGPAGPVERTWTWWPSWYELRTHYFRDIGFLACLSQMIGATVFWISGFTGLPQILNVLSLPATNGIYWLPQVVGGTGFIVSSWLFMLETQRKWYIPAPTVLGWHIGFWNLIGALGFTLCGALGFASSNEACELALTWSTFLGSWAFLVGSVIQWYESLDKYPIIIDKRMPRASEQLEVEAEAQA